MRIAIDIDIGAVYPAGEISPDFTDTFDGTSLNARWTPTAPSGSTIDATPDGFVDLICDAPDPDADMFYPTPGITSPRIMASPSGLDGDFEVTTEWVISGDYLPDTDVNFEGYGIWVREDDLNWIRADFYTQGASSDKFYFGYNVEGENSDNTQEVANTSISVVPTHIRIRRKGNIWFPQYSTDGIVWESPSPLVTLEEAYTVADIGAFSGALSASPGYTGRLSEVQYAAITEAESAYSETLVDSASASVFLSKASLTGQADSKTALVFMSGISDGAGHVYGVSQDSASSYIRKSNSGNAFQFRWHDTGGADAVDFTGRTIPAGERFNLLVAIDTDARHYSVLWSPTTYKGLWVDNGNQAGGGETLDFTPATSIIVGSGDGKYGRVAMWQGISVPNISLRSIQELFADAIDGTLKDPAESVAAFGTPIIDFYGAAAVWNAGTNQGSGGDFAKSGAAYT